MSTTHVHHPHCNILDKRHVTGRAHIRDFVDETRVLKQKQDLKRLCSDTIPEKTKQTMFGQQQEGLFLL